MSEPVKRFTLTVRLDASLAIDGGRGAALQNWVKPGVEAAISWGSIPSEDDLKAATQFLSDQVTEPILTSVVGQAHRIITDMNDGT